MRRSVVLLAFVCFLLPLRAAVPALIEEALGQMAVNFDHWSYVETITERNGKGRVLNETVVRYDPSKPFAEQFTVLSVDGKPPTAEHRKKWREIGEKRAARNEEAQKEGVAPPRKSVGELMDLDRAALISEDTATAVFAVPLKKDGSSGLPPDKIRLLVRIDKATRTFARIDGVLQKPFRTALIFKARSGEGHIVFSSVDPKFPPVITSISGHGSGSIFFVRLERSYEHHRAEFQRVKPYSDRFQVKMGPLKAIDF